MPSSELAKRPLKKIRVATAKYPWEEIRDAFIEGLDIGENGTKDVIWPDHRQLATHFKAPLAQIRNRASKERWEDHRNAFQNKQTIARQKEHAKRMAGKATQFDEEVFETSDFGRQLVQARLEEMYAASQSGAAPPGRSTTHISGYELEKLANALSKFTDTGRLALGVDDKAPSGPGNTQNVEINQINISEELARNDDQRIAGVLGVLTRKDANVPGSEGLKALLGLAKYTDDPEDENDLELEGEVVPDTPEMKAISAQLEALDEDPDE